MTNSGAREISIPIARPAAPSMPSPAIATVPSTGRATSHQLTDRDQARAAVTSRTPAKPTSFPEYIQVVTQGSAAAASTEKLRTTTFSMVGVSWTGAQTPQVEVRVSKSDQWREWQELPLQEDLPDEVDLDLGGWLTNGMPLPPTAEVSELWHLLYDDPDAGRALGGEQLGEAYDDLVEEEPDWFAVHGPVARKAMADAVELTGMEYGGITPIGLPESWPVLVDEAVAAAPFVVIGSGLRRSKLALSGAALARLKAAEVLPVAMPAAS